MSFGGYLQANTAVDVLIGPFVDDTDGKTAETGLTLSQADIKLSKNGQALAQKTTTPPPSMTPTATTTANWTPRTRTRKAP